MSDSFIKFIAGDLRRATLWHCLLIALVGLAVYANTFGVPFHLDDLRAILQNPGVVNMDIPFADRRAVGLWSFALDYRLHGLHVAGYHVVNLAIHVATALMVYALVLNLGDQGPGTRDRQRQEAGSGKSERSESVKVFTIPRSPVPGPRSIALFTALLFVAHPVQTQAVTYIVQRFASLATFFFMGAVVCYVRGRLTAGGKGWLWHAAGLACAVLAMKTKEISFTLPVVIALCEALFFRGGFFRRAAVVAPYLLTMAIIPLTLVNVGGAPAGQVLDQARQATSVQTVLPRADYLFTQFRVIITYLRLLIFPVNQNLDYDYPVYHTLFAPPVFLSFLLLLALFAMAVWIIWQTRSGAQGPGTGGRGPGKSETEKPCENERSTIASDKDSHDIEDSWAVAGPRLIAFGLLWVFITLSVESSVIPIVDVIFEHRVYLPSIGAILAFVSGAVLLAERRRLAAPLFAGLSVVVMIFAGAAFRRNMVWGDEVRLWSDVIAKSPNLSRPWNNVGYALLKRNEPQQAIPALVRSIELMAGYTDAHLNIEMALRRMGGFAGRMSSSAGMVDALGNVDVRQLRRWGGMSNNNLGLAYEIMGRKAKARAFYERALRMDPEMVEARENLKKVNSEWGMVKTRKP